MALPLRIYLSLLIGINLNAQNYTSDFKVIIGAANSITTEQLLNFEKKYKQTFDKYPDNSVQFYALLGNLQFNNGDYQNAGNSYAQSFQFAKTAADTQLIYITELNLAQFYHHQNYLTESEKFYNACMYGMSVIYGQSSREYTQIFYDYTGLLVDMGKYEAAKPNIEALLFYYKTLDGENNLKYLSLLNYKAIILQNLGQYNDALAIYKNIVEDERALKIKDTSAHVTSFLNLGDCYRESGDYTQAIYYLKLAHRTQKLYGLKEDLTTATIYNNLALSYKATSDFKTAEECYNKAIGIYKQLDQTQTEPYCSVLSNKGDLLRELGRFNEAAGILQLALNTRAERFGTQTENYANAATNLGMVLQDAGQYREALDIFLKAKTIYASTVGEKHQGYANILNCLSLNYLYLKEYKNAEEYKTNALMIIEQSVGKSHYRYASYLISGSGLYIRTKNYKKAESNLKEALELTARYFGKTHELYALAQFKLAEVYSLTNRYEEAGLYYLPSLDYYAKQLNDYFDAMSEEDQMAFLSFVTPVIESFNDFVLNYHLKQPNTDLSVYTVKMLEYQIRLKSLLTSQSAQLRQQIILSGDEGLRSIYQNWILAKNELINNYKSTQAAFDDTELMKTISDLEVKLKARLNGFKRERFSTFDNYKKWLLPQEALVEIFKVDELVTDSSVNTLYGALITKASSKAPELIIYQNGNYIDSSGFDYYYRHIDQQLKDSLSYISFFKPIDRALGNATKVYLSPSGVFHKINVAGLWNQATKTYVADKLTIQIVLNTSDYKRQKSAATVKKTTAALFGYPDFDFDLKARKQASGSERAASRYGLTNLSKLPGTKTEVEEARNTLQKNNWHVSLFTDEHASEANLRTIASPAILHIATHGYFLSDVTTSDKLLLGFENSKLRYNAALRSGLILAGVGPATSDSLNTNSENDGVLTAKEAELLNLANTDLVVLSACQTGLGAEMGSEGVAGLQRAFTIAGARYIIMSLWPVDDTATQLLMTSFYKQFVLSADPEKAFEEARSFVRKTYPHPYFWSAFQLLKTVN